MSCCTPLNVVTIGLHARNANDNVAEFAGFPPQRTYPLAQLHDKFFTFKELRVNVPQKRYNRVGPSDRLLQTYIRGRSTEAAFMRVINWNQRANHLRGSSKERVGVSSSNEADDEKWIGALTLRCEVNIPH